MKPPRCIRTGRRNAAASALSKSILSLELLCLAWTAHAAFDAYLLLPGIPGEATEANHADWIQVESFSEGQVSGLTTPGATFTDLVITKQLDKATPLLTLANARGTLLGSARLQLLTDSARSIVFYDIQLSNVVVTSVSDNLAPLSTNGVPTETVSLRFDSVSWTYTIINSKGMAAGTVEGYWNLVADLGWSASEQYPGNGDTSFGGAIGNGNLMLSNNATTVFGTVQQGNGGFNDVLVIYLDTGAPGFADTSGLADGADGLRRAISGVDGGANRSLLTFSSAPGSFRPSYAVALGPISDSFGGLYQLASGSENSLKYIGSVGLTPTGTGVAGSYSFSFDFSQIGINPVPGASFKLLGTYISNTGYRSSEAVAGNVYGAAGWNPFSATQYSTYTLPSAPSLRLFRTLPTTVVVAWPKSAAGYTLEETVGLEAPNWTPVTNTVSVVGSECQVVISSAIGHRFYRLKQ